MNKYYFKIALFPLIVMAHKVSSQTIVTYAGTGTAGAAGDGSVATSAQINLPYEIASDNLNNIYIADCSNNRIRKVTPNGIITTIAGTSSGGFGGDGGPAINATLNYPVGIDLDSTGNIYFLDRLNYRIRKISTNGIITTIAGNGSAGYSGDGGPATAAQFELASGLTVDKAGNVYFCDQGNYRIRKIDLSGIITTVAGTGINGFSGDGGSATAAKLGYLLGLTIDENNNLYVADASNNRIRKITSSGIISTIAGNGAAGYSGNGGPALNASLNQPGGAMIDKSGNLYIADYLNNRIRKVNQAGVISTYAGTGIGGSAGDGGLAINAQLQNPFMVTFDNIGNLYISDRSNNKIRKVYCIQPSISVSATSPSICAGQTATLSASGASSIIWSPSSSNNQSVAVSPSITTTYTATGTNTVSGCSGTGTLSLLVETCTDVKSNQKLKSSLLIFPNPTTGKINISSDKRIEVKIYNVAGKLVGQITLNEENNFNQEVFLSERGIYFIDAGPEKKKIIVK